MSDLIGRTLWHCRITAKIGAGGMGVVYRARDECLDREVAIKVLPDEVAQTRDRLDRFQHEAKAVAKLDHPNILAIQDLGTAELRTWHPCTHAPMVNYGTVADQTVVLPDSKPSLKIASGSIQSSCPVVS